MRMLVPQMRKYVSRLTPWHCPGHVPIPGGRNSNSLTEHPCGVSPALPADLSHRYLDRQVSLAQKSSKSLGAHCR
mgnify:CR=1 FL=1